LKASQNSITPKGKSKKSLYSAHQVHQTPKHPHHKESITLNSFDSKKQIFVNEFLCSLCLLLPTPPFNIEKNSTLKQPAMSFALSSANAFNDVTDGKRRIQDPREGGGVTRIEKICAASDYALLSQFFR
jgi:hypothetical protein